LDLPGALLKSSRQPLAAFQKVLGKSEKCAYQYEKFEIKIQKRIVQTLSIV
jgi:hypothetical protein